MKKIFIILGIVFVSFISFEFIYSSTTKVDLSNNPYLKDELHPETIEQLNDENYQNIILPKELDSKLTNREDTIVYYYSPICPHCLKITPIIVPIAKNKGIDIAMYNLLEFNEGWTKYNIENTPTLVYYDGGTEEERIVGTISGKEFEDWINSTLVE